MNDERRTPRWLFNKLDGLFHFTLDSAATDKNTLVPAHYFTKEVDGLKQSWANETVWCNPPYSRGQLKKWISKSIYESNASTIVMLIPGDCSTSAGQLALNNAIQTVFINKRIKFPLPDQEDEKGSPQFCSWLSVFSNKYFDLASLDLGVVK